ncbi:phosphoribosylformylglycinamidine synthase [Patescibacteria group bacterium]|nr:phosphoribosylformylglycinamidine synthase [Patescibacteria group bacterium]
MIVSRFRTSKLWEIEEQLWLKDLKKEVSPLIEGVKIERRFYVDSKRPFRSGELERLEGLLRETFEPEKFGSQTRLAEPVFEAGPRLAWVSPQSTSAVSICHACELDLVTRIETNRRFQITTRGNSLLTSAQRKQIYALIHDRMTEQVYPEPVTSFEIDVKPAPVQLIPLLEKGVKAIKQANEQLGLAIDEQMAEYIHQYCKKIGRNPTDAELFMFGQLNSEHCRHHRFNGKYIIDGQEMPDTLFGMIKATTEANQANVLVAYTDNAAVLSGRPVTALVTSDPTRPSPFACRPISSCILAKVETHNHPTAIDAYDGSATGLGGVIRDPMGTGRGGIVTVGLACYYVANLFIPDYILLWEKEYASHPKRFQTPLEIIIQASNGASYYGNMFGQPVILGSFTSFEQMIGKEHHGWRKTCMVAGNFGYIDEKHAYKMKPEKGYPVVQLGGDRYWIGLGGGSGSSKDAGAQEEELDWNSVQRANPEMENRMNDVFQACSELGDENPIVSTTDLGAGGESVALPEISFPAGARYELREIPCGDKTMPVYVFWCNESQESMVMIVWPERLETLRKICQRNRCPMYVVGEITGDGKLVVTDRSAPDDAPREQKIPIDVDMNFLLANLPQMTIKCQKILRQLKPLQLPEGLTVMKALERVLRLPKVASKQFLTRKVDRSVGGLVAQQQTVGPCQLTLADCAVTADSFFVTTGTAMAIGEQPIKGLVNPKAGGRMSLGESLTNLVWALVESFESINFSATWQWPCKQPGEDARLYEAVKATSGLCRKLGLRIPVGKDSVSMTAWTTKNDQKHPVKSPGTVQMISFAPCPDITRVVTPDIKMPGQSKLMLIDLSRDKQRLGGSALAQVHNQIGNQAPDVENPQILRQGFEAIQELIRRDLILAGHDRSDGGLITCLLEMAFAGNCGLYISFRRPIWKTNILPILFSEELGLVIEYLPKDERRILRFLLGQGLEGCCHILGRTTNDYQIKIHHKGQPVLSEDMRKLRNIWQETSYRLDKLQANPACVEAERKNTYDRKGLPLELRFKPEATPEIKMKVKQAKVAILREVGTNGDKEMAGAFDAAGFEAWDVTMTDLVEGRISLNDFRGIAFSGGFSYADVLDAGKGWAWVIKTNERVQKEFENFYSRPDTFSLGVCNGSQVMPFLGWIPRPGIELIKQPRFVRNESRIFESRPIAVKVMPSPALMLQDMEGSVLGIWVAHSEGRCFFPSDSILKEVLEKNLAPLRFVDDDGVPTMRYPYNPNGSILGITALCSPDGRHLAMMPHPERLFTFWQWFYWSRKWPKLKVSPWLKLFQNARKWCEEH